MGYSVKVKIAPNMSIEVSGDDLELVVQLLNESTKKFFPASPASKIEI
jgi:hypothetical protein